MTPSSDTEPRCLSQSVDPGRSPNRPRYVKRPGRSRAFLMSGGSNSSRTAAAGHCNQHSASGKQRGPYRRENHRVRSGVGGRCRRNVDRLDSDVRRRRDGRTQNSRRRLRRRGILSPGGRRRRSCRRGSCRRGNCRRQQGHGRNRLRRVLRRSRRRTQKRHGHERRGQGTSRQESEE